VIRTLGLGRQQRRRQRRLVGVLGGRQRRGGLDGVDADDGAAQALLVGADLRGQVGQRRLAAQLAAQRFASGLELTTLSAHATRPGVLAKGVDHGATHPPLGKGLELDAPVLIEAIGRVDEPNDAVLHQVADINRMRHGGRHPAGKSLDERQAGNDAMALRRCGERHGVSLVAGCAGPGALSQPRYQPGRSFVDSRRRQGVNGCKALKKQRLECELSSNFWSGEDCQK
jgi:hypothetical protein